MAWTHRLTGKDLTARTAVCSECGPVDLLRLDRGGRCGNSVRNHQGSPNRHNSKAEHGLTLTEARLYREGKVCEVCGTDRRLHVDHDHATGRVRGVLCTSHNTGLGLFHDSVEELEAAIAYLRKHGQ